MMRRALINLVVAMALSSCGGDPLTVWKVSKVGGETPAACFPDGIDPNLDRSTNSAQEEFGTWEMYEGPGDKFYLANVAVGDAAECPAHVNGRETAPLECGTKDVTLEGTLDGDTYTFQVTDKRVHLNGNPSTRTVTTTVTTTIVLKMDGEAFEGDWTQAGQASCELSGCEADFAVRNPSCTITHKVKGAKIDAQNYHPI